YDPERGHARPRAHLRLSRPHHGDARPGAGHRLSDHPHDGGPDASDEGTETGTVSAASVYNERGRRSASRAHPRDPGSFPEYQARHNVRPDGVQARRLSAPTPTGEEAGLGRHREYQHGG